MYFNALLKGMRYYIVFQFVTLYAQQDSIPKCSGCPCDKDLSPVGIAMSTVHPKGEWMLAYKPMFMYGKGMQYQNQSVTNNQVYQSYLMSSDKMHMQMHMLMAMYGISDRLTLMAMTDYRVNAMRMTMLPGHVHGGATVADTIATEKTSGFGDLTVSALYSIINQSNNVLMGTFGISIPTGSINKQGAHTSMYNNQRYPYMMQNGSGTFDALMKLTYSYNTNASQIGLQAHTIQRIGSNKYAYKLGNEYSATAWFSYRLFSFMSLSSRLEYVYNEKIKGEDTTLYAYNEPSANPLNYGGQKLFGHLGAFVYFFSTQKFGIEAGIPLYQNVSGYQIPTQFTLQAMYSIGF